MLRATLALYRRAKSIDDDGGSNAVPTRLTVLVRPNQISSSNAFEDTRELPLWLPRLWETIRQAGGAVEELNRTLPVLLATLSSSDCLLGMCDKQGATITVHLTSVERADDEQPTGCDVPLANDGDASAASTCRQSNALVRDAVAHKGRGNAHFAQQRYPDAMRCYTSAASKASSMLLLHAGAPLCPIHAVPDAPCAADVSVAIEVGVTALSNYALCALEQVTRNTNATPAHAANRTLCLKAARRCARALALLSVFPSYQPHETWDVVTRQQLRMKLLLRGAKAYRLAEEDDEARRLLKTLHDACQSLHLQLKATSGTDWSSEAQRRMRAALGDTAVMAASEAAALHAEDLRFAFVA